MASIYDDRLDHSYEGSGTTGGTTAYKNASTDPEFAVSAGINKVDIVVRPVDGNQKIPATGGSGAYPFMGTLGVKPEWSAGKYSNRSTVKVTPGERLRFSAKARYSRYSWSNGGLEYAYINLYFFSDAGGYISSATSGGGDRYQELIEGSVTVPAGAGYAIPYFRLRVGATGGTIPSGWYLALSDFYLGSANPKGGVFEVGASTEARLGIVSDIYSRSREKIQLKLAGVDDLVRSGHRIELAAAAMTSTPAVWHWRQVTGPTVALNVRENTCDFIAPDVERSTRIRIGVYAASEDGGNRSDWHYFDLDVEPPMLRFRGGDDGDFSPRSPYLVGYSRGKREIWNDVIRPATYEKNPRHELEVVDLGVPDDDVVFSTETPRRMAAGGVWVNPETGDVFRNFGAGYNETDDTTASPRTSTYWVNPANGDILEWIED